MSGALHIKGIGEVRSAHLLGVCGAGMEPIARALRHLGLEVSGSDPAKEKGAALARHGIRHFAVHDAANVTGQDVIIYSTAISQSNPEINRARQLGIPLLHRSEMLAHLLSLRETILIAGTHGKTTTTAMEALLLAASGLDPWAFVGGSVPEFGGNLRIGGGALAVAEADESDGTFLNLPASHAIITNIEAEHLNYWQSWGRLLAGFEQFVARVPRDGVVAVCVDDPGVRELIAGHGRPVVSWSTSGRTANFQARHIRQHGAGSTFELWAGDSYLTSISVGVPGPQNVSNAAGAAALAITLGARVEAIGSALANFRGVGRRFTRHDGFNGCLVIDDYAHHPTEIRATMAAAKTIQAERGGRLVGILQPHRYSRTQHFFDQFGPSLAGADRVIVTDVYGAGEAPVTGCDGASLSTLIRSQIPGDVQFIGPFDDIVAELRSSLTATDIVLLLGAGSVTNLASQLSSPAALTPETVPGGPAL